MDIIGWMFVLLAASFLMSAAFNRLGLPKVLGPILIGLLVAQEPFIHLFDYANTYDIFTFIKDIAIIFLLFFVGLKIDLNKFRKTSKRAIFIGLLAALLPFLLTFFSVIILNNLGVFGDFIISGNNVFLVAFVAGICLSVTAEGVIIEILEELFLVKSDIGQTVIEAGVIDDIFGLILISGLAAFLPGNSQGVTQGVIVLQKLWHMLVMGMAIFLIGKFLVPPLMKAIEKNKSSVDFFSVSIMITLFLATITQYFDLGGSILGALFAGIMIRHTLLAGDKFEKKEEKYITDAIEVTTFGFFAPFFFLWIGFNVNLYVFFTYPIFALIFLAVGLSGKLYGSILGNYFSGNKRWEGTIIGWAMNTRGGVDIMIATLALTAGLITINFFSLLIFVSFATTVISPVMFKVLVKKHHGL